MKKSDFESFRHPHFGARPWQEHQLGNVRPRLERPRQDRSRESRGQGIRDPDASKNDP